MSLYKLSYWAVNQCQGICWTTRCCILLRNIIHCVLSLQSQHSIYIKQLKVWSFFHLWVQYFGKYYFCFGWSIHVIWFSTLTKLQIIYSFNQTYDLYWFNHLITSQLPLVSDPWYMEVGESIINSLNTYTKVEGGFASIRHVKTMELEDHQHSFFLAETWDFLCFLFQRAILIFI